MGTLAENLLGRHLRRPLFLSALIRRSVVAKEQKSARELAPELNDAKFSIVAGSNPLDWRVRSDGYPDSVSTVSKELERAWAHVAYEYELKM
jgi:hypothetical protein